MKRFFKWIGYLLLLVILLGAGLFVHVWYFKPFSISIFYERVFMEYVLKDPELLSSIRLLEQVGLEFHNNDLTRSGPEQTEWVQQKLTADLETLRSYDREDLDYSQKLSYDILEWFLQNQVDGEPWAYHNYPLNQMFGIQSSLPDFMVNTHHISDVGDAEDYIERLDKFPIKFAQVLNGLELRESRNIIPPKFVVEKVLLEMRNFIGVPVNENLLYTGFDENLDEIPELSATERERLLGEAAVAIERSVYPAYGDLISYFERLQPKAATNHGAWALPNGDDFYKYQIRSHTTTDLTADEIHQIGLDEVARIKLEMDTILTAQGYTEGSVAERMSQLGAQERFLYSDSDEGRSQIIDDFQSMIDEIDQGMDAAFNVRPKMGVKVERIPEFKEKTSAGAYYQTPAMDGSRPGVFYANLRDVAEVQKFGMRTLAYHEAIPGHHFQLTIQQELTGVPQFRKMLPFTAYTEGWALYAERLAKEMGYQEDPFNDLGRLQAELFRGVRLVVDTGLHAKRWTREEAITYMLENTGMPEGDVTSEIERYMVMPGQALAYKIGMLKILELRERAKVALGDSFDLKSFHDVVLTNGSLPMEILEREVDIWIASKS